MDDLHSHTTYKPVLEEIPRPEDRGTNIKGVVREIVETIALALLIFLLVRLAAQNFRIEGSSMEPNLHNGQFLIVNKLVYYLHPPERGDVIVFQAPDSPRKDYIKRVVGLPGEEVEIVDGQVFVNGLRLEESYIAQPGSRSWGPEVVGDFEYLVLGDNRRNSRDSTNWGMLDGNAIIGKGWICYWPPRDFGLVPHYNFVAG